MNKEQKENLKTLLNLPKLIKKYGSTFNMKKFYVDAKKHTDPYYSEFDDILDIMYNCKTSACLAGHLPLTTGILKHDREDWHAYITRVTGIFPQYSESKHNKWDYLFSDRWSNSLDDAMERVKTFIANDYEAPREYDYDGGK